MNDYVLTISLFLQADSPETAKDLGMTLSQKLYPAVREAKADNLNPLELRVEFSEVPPATTTEVSSQPPSGELLN